MGVAWIAWCADTAEVRETAAWGLLGLHDAMTRGSAGGGRMGVAWIACACRHAEAVGCRRDLALPGLHGA